MADKRDFLIRLLGEETVSRMAGRAEKGLDKFGDSLDATEKDAKDLDAQIAEVEGSLKTLAVAFARTGDAADRIDITKAIRRQQTELRKLTKAKDLLDFDRLGDEAAHGFAARFGARLGPLMASGPIGSGAAAAGVALSAAMAPTLLAGLSGAVVGGAGLGGIVGGVILAARDERVKAAGADLGQYIIGDLEDRAAGFVPVMLGSIDKVRAGWADLGPDLDRIFASSRLVDPLVDGMVSGSKKLIHGVADAVDKADPVVRAFGRSMDRIGDAAGDVFTTLADDADEGASAIDDLTGSIENFIRVSGAILHAGATVKGWTNEVDVALDKGRYWIEDNSALAEGLGNVGIKLDLTADGFKAGSVEAEAYRAATLGTATATDFATLKQAGMTDAWIASKDASGTYRQKLDEVKAATQGGTGAVKDQVAALGELATKLRAQYDPAFALIDAQNGLKDAQKGYNQAVKEHGEKSPQAQEALRKQAVAAIVLEGAIGSAAGSFNGKLTPAMVATLRSAGFTEGQIADLEKQFKTAKAAGDKFAKDYHADVFVDWHYRTFGKPGTGINGIGGSTFKGRASGGPVKAGTPYMVGEEGPELITPTRAGWVHDAPATARMGATGGWAASGQAAAPAAARTVIELRSGGSRLDDLLVELLRKAIGDRGGNVQAVLGRG